MRRALCREADPDTFFAEDRNQVTRDRYERELVAGFCQSCPVMVECRTYALRMNEVPYGVWGGLTTKEMAQQRAALGRTIGSEARVKALRGRIERLQAEEQVG